MEERRPIMIGPDPMNPGQHVISVPNTARITQHGFSRVVTVNEAGSVTLPQEIEPSETFTIQYTTDKNIWQELYKPEPKPYQKTSLSPKAKRKRKLQRQARKASRGK